ncbi:MAG: S41 family peptidase [bacterium]
MKRHLSIVLIVAAFLCANSVYASDNENGASEPEREPVVITQEEFDSTLTEVIEKLRRDYYIEFKLTDKILTSTVRGLLEGLNEPYSRYSPPKEYWDKKSLSSYGGVGVTVDYTEKGLMVFRVVEDSSAEKAGIKPGDYITEIDGVNVAGLIKEELDSLFSGEIGSEVRLKVKQEDSYLENEYKIKRCLLQTDSVRGKTLNEGVGYIEILDFGPYAYAQFSNLLDEMSGKKLKALIIDLRYNPGGLVNEAKKISDIFIKEGLILTLEARDVSKNTNMYADGNTKIPQERTVALVNKYTASAAELLAGAIQHYTNIPIIGETTFGKALSQQDMPMSNGGVLRLTTGRAKIAGTIDINKIGIVPNVIIVPEKGTDGELEELLKINAKEREKRKDIVLEKAIAYVLGMKAE